MNYLDFTMNKIDFSIARQAFYRFCKNEQRMCIPVQKDDDDMILGDTLKVAEYQIKKLKKENERLANIIIHQKTKIAKYESIKIISDDVISKLAKDVVKLETENSIKRSRINELKGELSRAQW